jgi:hypothetical protein
MSAPMKRTALVSLSSLALLALLVWVWLADATPAGGPIAAPGTKRASSDASQGAMLRPGELADEAQREALSIEAAAAEASAKAEAASGASFTMDVAVLDPEGDPIAGATVQVLETPKRTLTSDELGLARLPLQAGTRRVELFLDAEGFMHARGDWRTAARIEVTLQRSTTARGRVVELESQAPIRAATVWLEDGHEGCQLAREAVAADGSFELDEVPLGAGFQVAAASAGYADGRVSLRLLEGESPSDVQVQLERSAGVQLRFVDFQTQRPISGVRVLNLPDLAASDERGLIDASRLAAESSTSFLLRASAPGYCGLLRHVQSSDWTQGGSATVPLIAGARFEGLVRDGDGQPIQGARIELQARNRQGNRFDASVQLKLPGWESNWMVGAESMEGVASDAAGRFVSLAVPPQSAIWRLEVSAEGHATAVVDPGATGDPGEATWVEVELAPARAGKIRGHLTLNGAPTSGQVLWTSGETSGRASADPTGAFLLEDVEPGEVRLRAEVTEGPRRFGRLLQDQVVTVALPPLAEIEQDLALALPVAATSGIVRTQRGDPMAGVEVRAALPDREANLRVKTGEDGRFELELPAVPQAWTLSTRGPWAAEPVTAMAGERDLVLLVTEVGRLRLRLIDEEDGQPLRQFEVLARQVGERASRNVSSSERNAPDPAGWIEVAAPSGPLDVTLIPFQREYMQVRSSVVVPAAGAPATRLELATTRGSLLRLELSDASDRPPRRSQLYLLEEDEARYLPSQGTAEDRRRALGSANVDLEALRARRIAFDPQGQTSLPGLRPGRYLLVDLNGGSFDPGEIELPRSGSDPLLVRWAPAP